MRCEVINVTQVVAFEPQLEMQSDLFGPSAKFLSIPSEIENESELLHGLRLKTGPHSDTARLLHHIRGARGKLHWAGEIRLAWPAG